MADGYALLGLKFHMPIRTGQWNEPVTREDGTRILISRYLPRGLPKSQQTWSEWIPHLGPSRALHAAAYGKSGQVRIAWLSYRRLYLEEMRGEKNRIADLARRSINGETITLLCSSACDREARCHRSLLKELIEAELRGGIN